MYKTLVALEPFPVSDTVIKLLNRFKVQAEALVIEDLINVRSKLLARFEELRSQRRANEPSSDCRKCARNEKEGRLTHERNCQLEIELAACKDRFEQCQQLQGLLGASL